MSYEGMPTPEDLGTSKTLVVALPLHFSARSRRCWHLRVGCRSGWALRLACRGWMSTRERGSLPPSLPLSLSWDPEAFAPQRAEVPESSGGTRVPRGAPSRERLCAG